MDTKAGGLVLTMPRRWLFPLLLLLAVTAAFAWLFKVRLGGGEIYPEYSSLRADALGTRALHDALADMPGFTVERGYAPLEEIAPGPRVILLAGMPWRAWQHLSLGDLKALSRSRKAGSRIVVAFRAETFETVSEHRNDTSSEKPFDADEDAGTEEKKSGESVPGKTEKEAAAKVEPTPSGTPAPSTTPTPTPDAAARRATLAEKARKEFNKEWGVELKIRSLLEFKNRATRAPGAPEDLPESPGWHSDVYFAPAEGSGWKTLYTRGREPVAIERVTDKGSVVLLADAFCLSNEAMDRERSTRLVAYLISNYKSVYFSEGSLGVLEENGIGFLARRYGLGGAVAMCALLAGLYLWRRLVLFLPVPAAGDDLDSEMAVHDGVSGFSGLLRRTLPRHQVLDTCVVEWRKAREDGGASPVQLRVNAAWQQRDPKSSLSQTYNALVRALKPH